MIKIKVSFDYVIDNEALERTDPNNPFLTSVKRDRKETVKRAINQLERDIEEFFEGWTFEGVENLKIYEDKSELKK